MNFGGFRSSASPDTRAGASHTSLTYPGTICNRFQALTRSLKTKNQKISEKNMKNLQNQQSTRSPAPAGALRRDPTIRNVSAHARADLMSKNSADTKNGGCFRENYQMSCLKKICGLELDAHTFFSPAQQFSSAENREFSVTCKVCFLGTYVLLGHSPKARLRRDKAGS